MTTTTVETARGPVATAELGATLMREHIVTRSPGVQEDCDILPALGRAGVTEEQIQQTLVGNPRAIFEGRQP
jgi:predicted metal-dependent phosphotriesterase family hydrolase